MYKTSRVNRVMTVLSSTFQKLLPSASRIYDDWDLDAFENLYSPNKTFMSFSKSVESFNNCTTPSHSNPLFRGRLLVLSYNNNKISTPFVLVNKMINPSLYAKPNIGGFLPSLCKLISQTPLFRSPAFCFLNYIGPIDKNRTYVISRSTFFCCCFFPFCFSYVLYMFSLFLHTISVET